MLGITFVQIIHTFFLKSINLETIKIIIADPSCPTKKRLKDNLDHFELIGCGFSGSIFCKPAIR
jgi:hypothetical protein